MSPGEVILRSSDGDDILVVFISGFNFSWPVNTYWRLVKWRVSNHLMTSKLNVLLKTRRLLGTGYLQLNLVKIVKIERSEIVTVDFERSENCISVVYRKPKVRFSSGFQLFISYWVPINRNLKKILTRPARPHTR